MRIVGSFSHHVSPWVIGAVAGVAILAASEGPSSARPLQTTLRSDARKAVVYISDQIRSFVDVFDLSGTRIGRITADLSYPSGLFVDAEHNLWVANLGDRDVLKFKRGKATPIGTYYSGNSNPTGVTMCPDGTLYVAAGYIAVFPRGHHHPTRMLTSQYGNITSVTCDAAGNVFATATVFSPPGYVVEFAGGHEPDTLLPINLENPNDVKIDAAGNLLVLDAVTPSTVGEYTEAGQPTGKSLSIGNVWVQIAILPPGNSVFGVDVSDSAGELVSFPRGRLEQSYTDSGFASTQPYGIAYDPG
ncbi:MAG: hypothetical protein JO043_07570 [Candidatus Eremiobacteraeota bacterium]|nr:hypothetical protein [Candidatus Eremiobacteraeota bacterium]